MNSSDEVVPRTTDEPTPLPHDVAGFELGRPPSAPPPSAPSPSTRPTPESVLHWIAGGGGQPWFPSACAKQAGISRDSLDEPLNELRLAGLVQIATWVRGLGQGYVLTAEGEGVVRRTSTSEAVRKPPERAEPPAEAASEKSPQALGLDQRPPVVTPAILLANLIWFFVGLVMALRRGVSLGTYLLTGDRAVLSLLGAVSADDLLRGDWWRLTTCNFVHVGLVHLIVNLFALGTAGPVVELVWGRWRLFVIYVLSGLAGSCLAMTLRPISADTGAVVVLAGASGAIWGVMTSLLAWLLLFRKSLRPDVASFWFRRLIPALVLNAGVSLLPGVSWEAHLGGGIVGFFAAGLMNALSSGARPRRLAAWLLLLALPGLFIGTLIEAMASGDSWAPLRKREVARRAAVERDAFLRDVLPLVYSLRPEAVHPVEAGVVRVWLVNPARQAAAAAEARASLEGMRNAAVTAQERLASEPTGNAVLDRYRDKAQKLVDARLQSFDMLFHMLDEKTMPDVSTWKAWGEKRGEANQLWAELNRR